jgi:hypothetical protein
LPSKSGTLRSFICQFSETGWTERWLRIEICLEFLCALNVQKGLSHDVTEPWWLTVYFSEIDAAAQRVIPRRRKLIWKIGQVRMLCSGIPEMK